MTLKDRLKAAWGGLTAPSPVDKGEPLLMSTTDIPSGSPAGQAILRAMATGDTAALAAAIAEAKRAHPPSAPMRADLVQQARAALGGDGMGNALPWDMWSREIELFRTEAPGWSPCRFYNRVGANEGRGTFGVTRGEFGIWKQGYPVCGDDDDDKVILPAVVHLYTGLNLCLCDTMETAIAVSDVLSGLDWAGMPPADVEEPARSQWAERYELCKTTLEFHGIRTSPERHAHDPNDGSPINIWVRGEPGEGKPVKWKMS